MELELDLVRVVHTYLGEFQERVFTVLTIFKNSKKDKRDGDPTLLPPELAPRTSLGCFGCDNHSVFFDPVCSSWDFPVACRRGVDCLTGKKAQSQSQAPGNGWRKKTGKKGTLKDLQKKWLKHGRFIQSRQ